jgi:hypothetical protein
MLSARCRRAHRDCRHTRCVALRDHPDIEAVVFCCFSAEDLKVYEALLPM